jgi:hypothetical protein
MLKPAGFAVMLMLLAFLGFSTARGEVDIVVGESCGENSNHIMLKSSSDKTIVAKLTYTEYKVDKSDKSRKKMDESSFEQKINPRDSLVLGCNRDINDPEIEHFWTIADAQYAP